VSLLLAESGRAVGGTERVVWELATRLPRHRFDVHVWLSPGPGVDELADGLAARGVSVGRVAEVDSRWDWRGMWDTWRRLRALRPTVLHVHHVWPAADRYLTLIAELAGVPCVVVTEHIEGRAHSGGQRRLKRRELTRADAVTAVCRSVADTLIRDYAVQRDRIRLVSNGADPPDEETEAGPARVFRQEMEARLDRPLWVCPGRLEEQKGHAVLIAALEMVAAGGLDFVVAFAGRGSLEADLERRVHAAGLADRVRFLGQVESIGPILAAADAVVLPSLWEGLPLTLLEAMVRARPVIASAVGGIPEVIEDGVGGVLVPPGDPAALAQALERFHRDPRGALALGEAGAAHVRERHSWDRVVDRFEDVYDEALGLASFEPRERAGKGADA
jgi:glycosyltransferase involved in cell wall biosynthesis